VENEKSLQRVTSKKSELTPYDFIICPNCGETEVGKYCPNCGQSNKDFNKPVKEIIGDLLDSINLDIRLLNTLIPFFTKPGFLTEEYFKGRRKRYVPPMRMYMIVSIIFFFLVQYTSFDELRNDMNTVDHGEKSSANFVMNKDLKSIAVVSKADTVVKNNISITDLNKEDIEAIKQETLNDTAASSWEKQMVIGGLNAAEKKDVFFTKFLNNLSYVLFLLMPFFALILSMILWKSRMLYIKHLIFSINFHAFIFGLSSIIIVLNEYLPESVSDYVLFLWWGIPLYLMFGVKRFYHRSYVGAFFKMFGALSLYTFVLSIVVIMILAFTAKGFYSI
jgi:hypothetical protein